MRIESVLIPATRWIVARPKLADRLFRLDSWGNPFSEEFMANPMANVELYRKDVPVVWKPLYQQWMITGFDEAREVLASPHVGTANQAEVLLDVSPYTKLSEQSRSFFANFMLLTDPPLHARLRGLVNRAFTPRQVARLEERMNGIIDGLIADLPAREIELMGDFATAFPSTVIAELFGLPEDEWPWLRSISPTLAQLVDPVRGFDPAEMDAVIADIHERIVALASERRANPQDDLITGLAMAEADDGDRLSEDELVSVAGFILVAGHETTAGQIGTSILHLHDHPDQLDLLRRQPDLWPNAVDELLRFDPAVRADPRTAREDFEVAGHKIRKGQNIAIIPQLCNRDLRRLPDADELRVDRPDPQPLSFGHGIHYCIGANLARAELRMALPRLIDALGDFSIDPSRIEWRQSITLRGPARMPITRG